MFYCFIADLFFAEFGESNYLVLSTAYKIHNLLNIGCDLTGCLRDNESLVQSDTVSDLSAVI